MDAALSPQFDLVLFGATGFVGKLVAEHLADQAPESVRIALAGRSRARLQEVRAGLPSRAGGWDLLVADSADRDSLDSLVARTRVVVSTVGPYLRHGIPLVEACAEAGTDYVDLTGEVLFVREIIDRCHAKARTSGARIVVSGGFDSVPSDLAVHLLRRRIEADGGGGLTDTTLRVRTLRGGVSGGTVDSLRQQLDQVRGNPSLRRVVADPQALSDGAVGADGQGDVWRAFVDAETGTWVAPFVMAPYNTRVVRRSHALRGSGYGPSFRYREVIPTGEGLRGRARAMAVVAGLGALMAGMSTPGLRRLLDRVLPSPGAGPSAQRRAAGAFEVRTSTVSQSGRRYTATIAAQGDPGYAATSVMLGQAGLALVLGEDRLWPEGGVLTPAVALGDVLVERLRAQGFTLRVSAEEDADDRVAYLGRMSKDTPRTDPAKETSEGTLSEGGSSSLNAETAIGGADSVPETPDVNDDHEDSQDTSVAKDEDGR